MAAPKGQKRITETLQKEFLAKSKADQTEFLKGFKEYGKENAEDFRKAIEEYKKGATAGKGGGGARLTSAKIIEAVKRVCGLQETFNAVFVEVDEKGNPHINDKEVENLNKWLGGIATARAEAAKIKVQEQTKTTLEQAIAKGLSKAEIEKMLKAMK